MNTLSAQVPRVILTDTLKSYGGHQGEMLPGVEHRQHRYLNTGTEHLHHPTRQWERRMHGFQSAGHAPQFLSTKQYGREAKWGARSRGRRSWPQS